MLTKDDLKQEIKALKSDYNKLTSFLDDAPKFFATTQKISSNWIKTSHLPSTDKPFTCYNDKSGQKQVNLPNNSPVLTIGDIHADGRAFDEILKKCLEAIAAGKQVVFLGDYTDRGKNNLDVILGVLLLKQKFPDQVTVLGGNHESPNMAEKDGFFAAIPGELDEAGIKIDAKQHNELKGKFSKIFSALPKIAYKGPIVFVHAGLPFPGNIYANNGQIATIPTSTCLNDFLDEPQHLCLVWSDPTDSEDKLGTKIAIQNDDRFCGQIFGKQAMLTIAKEKHDIELVVRGHQSKDLDPETAQNDPLFSCGGYVLTVFSTGWWPSGKDTDETQTSGYVTDVNRVFMPYIVEIPADNDTKKIRILPLFEILNDKTILLKEKSKFTNYSEKSSSSSSSQLTTDNQPSTAVAAPPYILEPYPSIAVSLSSSSSNQTTGEQTQTSVLKEKFALLMQSINKLNNSLLDAIFKNQQDNTSSSLQLEHVVQIEASLMELKTAIEKFQSKNKDNETTIKTNLDKLKTTIIVCASKIPAFDSIFFPKYPAFFAKQNLTSDLNSLLSTLTQDKTLASIFCDVLKQIDEFTETYQHIINDNKTVEKPTLTH